MIDIRSTERGHPLSLSLSWILFSFFATQWSIINIQELSLLVLVGMIWMHFFYRSLRMQCRHVNIIHSIQSAWTFSFCIRFFSTQDFELFINLLKWVSLRFCTFDLFNWCVCPLCVVIAAFDDRLHQIHLFRFACSFDQSIYLKNLFHIPYRKSFSNMPYVQCC